jgi:LacI family transcriptional regulator
VSRAASHIEVLAHPTPGRPTMRDVAALAGVALKTVSRVFNDVPTVDPELAARVRAAAEKLGYRPNLTASSLRRRDGRTGIIGLLLDNVANPFSGAVQRAVEDVAREEQVQVLTGSLDEDAIREKLLARILIDRRVDGLIIMPVSSDHSYLAMEQRAGTPVVFVDREPSLMGADVVVSANRDGARAAVDHLIEGGHRSIAYLGDSHTLYTAGERLAGFQEALKAARLAADPCLIRQDLSNAERAEQAAGELLDLPTPPTALFAGQNLVTIGAIRALRARELERRIALVGFDDFLLADLLQPAITVIRQDPSAMGTRAAEVLFDRINGDQGPTARHVLPTELIARGSGEIASSR